MCREVPSKHLAGTPVRDTEQGLRGPKGKQKAHFSHSSGASCFLGMRPCSPAPPGDLWLACSGYHALWFFALVAAATVGACHHILREDLLVSVLVLFVDVLASEVAEVLKSRCAHWAHLQIPEAGLGVSVL